MSKSNHVPKFGNWDANEQTQFTIVFEKARADHKGGTGSGSNMMDPSNLFQNPAAFEMKATENPRSARKTFRQYIPDKSQKMAGKVQNKNTGPVRPIMVDPAKNGSLGGVNGSEDSSHLSSSLRGHPGNRAAVMQYLGTERKGVREGSTPVHQALGKKRHLRQAFRGNNMFPGQGSPLPKFGAWDEKDPSAGDVFTAIFSNARKEKIIGPTPISTHLSESSVKDDFDNVYKPPSQSIGKKMSVWLCCAPS